MNCCLGEQTAISECPKGIDGHCVYREMRISAAREFPEGSPEYWARVKQLMDRELQAGRAI